MHSPKAGFFLRCAWIDALVPGPPILLTDCCQEGYAIVSSSKKRRLAMSSFAILCSVQHYVGKIRTMRNEIRTQRFMNGLPADIREDIGWPDMYANGRLNDN